MRYKIIALPVLFVILVSTLVPLGASSSPGAQAAGPARPEVRYATRTDTTKPLRVLPEIPPKPEILGQIFVKPLKRLPNRSGVSTSSSDPVVQVSVSGTSAPSTGTDFEGVNNVNGVLPPDTVGAIGPNNYVQMVNLSFAIFDRSGTKLYGPVANSTLWQGFGGPCETTNNGDPIVLYDHLAGRWMMSQFALPRFPRGPFYQCIAVSQTGDPTGSWHRYEFTISNDKLNDYPKFGLWPDGYYMSVNQFKCNFAFCNWGGAGVVAFERDQMLNGQPARMVYFDLLNVDSNLGGMLPADLDGPVPPAGLPNPFLQIDDNAWGYSPDQVQLWNFHVDWNNPANSTFTFDKAVQVASFDSDLCGYSRNCIPQPGGTALDAISDRAMYRLQYRNFGSYETLVTNHTVDTGGDHAGVRWYELRDTGSGWDVRQQGTFAPDNANRWMGSIAMNGAGDIGLGYSVSSRSISPSIRVTGRLAGDALNQMTQSEAAIVNGSGYQTHSSGRWGDYSSMTVDPTDDCTFWYTQEYYNSESLAGWQTRIGSFQISSCGGAPVDNPPTVSITNPADGATVSNTLDVTVDASDDNEVTQVEFFVDGTSIGVDTNSSDGWSASWDTTAYSNGDHTVSATATDTANQTDTDNVSVTVDNSGSSADTMHVADLTGSSVQRNKKFWYAVVMVTIFDQSDNPVANATVNGTWSGGYTGSGSCTTDATGTCSLTTGNISSPSVTFTVDNVSHNSLTYDSGANTVTSTIVNAP